MYFFVALFWLSSVNKFKLGLVSVLSIARSIGKATLPQDKKRRKNYGKAAKKVSIVRLEFQ